MRENEGRQATQDWCVGECWEIGETLPGRLCPALLARLIFLEFSTFFGVYLSIFFNINEIIDNIFFIIFLVLRVF